MKRATYKCGCGSLFTRTFNLNEKIPLRYNCQCGKEAKRTISTVFTENEDEMVSSAAQKMLWSTLPSGRDKVAI